MGAPRGRLRQYEQKFPDKSWQVARAGVSVKLLTEGAELYVWAESKDRVCKERAMRGRQTQGLCRRLKALQRRELPREALLKKLGAALHEFPAAARLIQTTVAPQSASPSFTLRQDKRQAARQREGRYLLRGNITSGRAPEELWRCYIQLTEVEAAFKNLKSDLALRPIHHQLEPRIEAHSFIAFLAYCLQVSLRRRLRDLAPGPDAAGGAGKVRHYPAARRASAHRRCAHGGVEPLHPTGGGCAPAPARAQAGVAAPTPTQNHQTPVGANPGIVVKS